MAPHQHVALVTGAAVTAHSVVALVVTPSVPLAALINICTQDGDTADVRGNKRHRRELHEIPRLEEAFKWRQALGLRRNFKTLLWILFFFFLLDLHITDTLCHCGGVFSAVVKWKRLSPSQAESVLVSFRCKVAG